MITRLYRAEEEGSLEACAKLLRDGALCAFPTETVYGLGANALLPHSVRRIFEAKGRPSDNPLIVHLADSSQIPALCAEFSQKAELLCQTFMPGPFTLILPQKDRFDAVVTAGLPTVAFRVPSDPVAHKLLSLAGVPVAAPSANASGRPSPTAVQHVLEDLDGKVEAILDGGPCSIGVESTVLSLAGPVPKLLRPGDITVSQIEDVIGPIEISPALLRSLQEHEKAEAPGMKYRHYAPKCPLTLLDGSPEKALEWLMANQISKDSYLLCQQEDRDLFKAYSLILSGSRQDPLSQEQALFASLRKLDERQATVAYALLPPDEDRFRAVRNRLLKAGGFQVIHL